MANVNIDLNTVAAGVATTVISELFALIHRRSAALLPPPTEDEARSHLHIDTRDWAADLQIYLDRTDPMVP
jgi:hypothetical protein